MHTYPFAAARSSLLGTWSAVIAVGMAIVFAVQGAMRRRSAFPSFPHIAKYSMEPVIAVTTDSGWQPMLASVSRSACIPVAPDGSEAAKVSTTGGAP